MPVGYKPQETNDGQDISLSWRPCINSPHWIPAAQRVLPEQWPNPRIIDIAQRYQHRTGVNARGHLLSIQIIHERADFVSSSRYLKFCGSRKGERDLSVLQLASWEDKQSKR